LRRGVVRLRKRLKISGAAIQSKPTIWKAISLWTTFVFIAGGIGITPFRAILLDLDYNKKPLNV
jgi:ferredoxin-NADP reductase